MTSEKVFIKKISLQLINMFLGQADIVPPIGGTTECPSDYEYYWSDEMCHYITSDFPGECQSPLVWSNISQDCVLSVGSTTTGGGSTAASIPWNYILLGLGALMLLSFAGGRRSGGGSRKKSQKIFSRTTTRTQFA